MSRKLISLFLVIALLCGLTACGASVSKQKPQQPVSIAERSGLVLGEVVSELDPNPQRTIYRNMEVIQPTLITRLDGRTVPEDFYLYRNMLSEAYRDAYDQVCQGLMQQRKHIPLSFPVPKENFQYVYYAVLYDHPEIFWMQNSISLYYNNDGNITQIDPVYWNIDVAAMTAEMEQSASEALADMWSLETDVEKVKYAHDYLTHTITYAHNDLDQTAYSGFVWKQTVCTGYSKCFAYLMHKMGIPCAVIVGMAGGLHAWNILKLNGEYYVMDVTWDDYDTSPNDYSYKYFDITDRQISADHTRGGEKIVISLSLPAANGTAMSYENAFNGNAYGTDFDAIHGIMPVVESLLGWPDNDSNGYNSNDYDDSNNSNDWWRWLNDSWSLWDWDYDGERRWTIYDDETKATYIYDEGYGTFGAYSNNDPDTIYWLNMETNEWE